MIKLVYKDLTLINKGGPGSGHFGHSGRPGLVGGSSSDSNFQPFSVPEIDKDVNWNDERTWKHVTISLTSTTSPFDRSSSLALKEDIQAFKFLSEDVTASNRYVKSEEDKVLMNTVLSWKYNEDEEKGRIKDEIVTQISKDSGVDYDTTNSIVKQWAMSSNDHSVASLSIQEAIAEEFGLELSKWQKEKLHGINEYIRRKDEFDELERRIDNVEQDMKKALGREVTHDEVYNEFYRLKDKLYAMRNELGLGDMWFSDPELVPLTTRDNERKVLRAIYTNTQNKLKEYGYKPGDTITLFRGMNITPEQGRTKIGKIFNYIGNTIESWSASYSTANIFGNFIASISIPIESIFSTAKSGMGCLNEAEFIIFGNIPGSKGLAVFSSDTDNRGNPYVYKGGAGSGHFGHEGRPGLVGGSSSDSSSSSAGSVPEASEGMDIQDPDTWENFGLAQMRGVVDHYHANRMPFQETEKIHKFMSKDLRVEEGWVDEEKLLAWTSAADGVDAEIKDEIVTDISYMTGIDYDTVNDIIAQWAGSSNDHDIKSLSLQEAAAEEFGIELSDWQKERLAEVRSKIDKINSNSYTKKITVEELHAAAESRNELLTEIVELGDLHFSGKLDKQKYDEAVLSKYDELKKVNEFIAVYTAQDVLSREVADKPITDRVQEKQALRAIYTNTQNELKKSGFKKGDRVTLFRGVAYKGDNPSIGSIVNYKGNAIESWTIGEYVTGGFGTIALAMSVPVENIFSTARTGMGCLVEGEVIIFGNMPDSKALVIFS